MSNTIEISRRDLVEYYGESMLYPENRARLDHLATLLTLWRSMIATSHTDVRYFVEFLTVAEQVRQYDKITEGLNK